MTAKKEAPEEHFNKRVAKARKARGDEWKKTISKMKMYHVANPTRLRKKRIDGSLTQSEVARNVGMSLTTYGDIERGKRPLKKSVAQKLAVLVKSQVPNLFKCHGDHKLIAVR